MVHYSNYLLFLLFIIKYLLLFIIKYILKIYLIYLFNICRNIARLIRSFEMANRDHLIKRISAQLIIHIHISSILILCIIFLNLYKPIVYIKKNHMDQFSMSVFINDFDLDYSVRRICSLKGATEKWIHNSHFIVHRAFCRFYYFLISGFSHFSEITYFFCMFS